MHYQVGSGNREDVFSPGLWGPWLTVETPGWMYACLASTNTHEGLQG